MDSIKNRQCEENFLGKSQILISGQTETSDRLRPNARCLFCRWAQPPGMSRFLWTFKRGCRQLFCVEFSGENHAGYLLCGALNRGSHCFICLFCGVLKRGSRCCICFAECSGETHAGWRFVWILLVSALNWEARLGFFRVILDENGMFYQAH
jgi:hypothetical protein